MKRPIKVFVEAFKTNPTEFKEAFLGFKSEEWPSIEKEKIEDLLGQYRLFCLSAIHMLLDASISSYKWPALKEELLENIKEELGSQTNGIPHLKMMELGYAEIGLTSNSLMFHETKFLISKLFDIFNSNDIHRLAGGLVAFETLAIGEYTKIEDLVRIYAKNKDIALDENGYLLKYIKGHQEFEIGHSDHLIEAVEKGMLCAEGKVYLSENFVQGFYDVTLLLKNWWKNFYTK